MKVYQENKESVNGSIQIINSTVLYEKGTLWVDGALNVAGPRCHENDA
jgi:hypothetical protein